MEEKMEFTRMSLHVSEADGLSSQFVISASETSILKLKPSTIVPTDYAPNP